MPKLPSEELIRLAQEIAARLSRGVKTPPVVNPETAVETWARTPFRGGELRGTRPILEPEVFRPEDPGRGFVNPGPGQPDVSPLPKPEELAAPVLDAATAMDKLLQRVLGTVPEVKKRTGLTPEQRPKWLKGKAGEKLKTEAVLSPEDVQNEVGERFLNDANRFPHKTPDQIRGSLEAPTRRWAEQQMDTVKTPKDVIERRWMVANAGKRRGVDPNSPEFRQLLTEMKSKNLLERRTGAPLETPRSRDMETGEVSSSPEVQSGLVDPVETPHEALMRKQAGEPPENEAMRRVLEWLRSGTGRQALTDKQKDLLSLRYGLDRPGGGSYNGETSLSALAKYLDVNLSYLQTQEASALSKIKLMLNKAGLTPTPKTEIQGPPLPIRPSAASVGRGPFENEYVPRESEAPYQIAKHRTFEVSPSKTIEPGLPITVQAQGPPRLVERGPGNWEPQYPQGPSRLTAGVGKAKLSEETPAVKPKYTYTKEAAEPRTAAKPYRKPVKGLLTEGEAGRSLAEEAGLPQPKSVFKEGVGREDRIQQRVQERIKQFENSRGYRLVKDPEGDIEIAGERYRRGPQLKVAHVSDGRKKNKTLTELPETK